MNNQPNYIIRMESDEYGQEDFEYDSLKEAQAGLRRLKADIRKQKDGIARRLELMAVYEEVTI